MRPMEMQPIGFIESPFKQKFGIPRQSGLVSEAKGILRFVPPYDTPDALQGLDGFSHIWVQFVFHKALSDQWRPTVRPPRLGGNERMGVFATRSPFRPNGIGLSVVKLDQVHAVPGDCWLQLSGVDILDQSPVLDIKPYVGYADSIPDAVCGFAPEPPSTDLVVHFSSIAEKQLKSRPDGEHLRQVIRDLLALDPRPAYRDESEEREYGMSIYDFDLRWKMVAGEAVVLRLA